MGGGAPQRSGYLGVHWPTDVLAGWVLGVAAGVAARVVLRGRTPAAEPADRG